MKESDAIRFIVLAPEKKILDVTCSKVTLPGTKGSFTVLKGHRALLSSLDKGKISYSSEGRTQELDVRSGFVEVKDNEVTACVEL